MTEPARGQSPAMAGTAAGSERASALEHDIIENLPRLYAFVSSQLRLHEGFADLKRREVLPEEIIDATVVAALEQGARPAGEAAYPWLRGLARRQFDRALAEAREQDAIVYESDMGNALVADAEIDTGAAGRPQDMVGDDIDPATALSTEENAVEDEFQTILARVLLGLPEEEREALLLSVRDGRDAAEVARIEGIAPDEARRRIAAAEGRLRDGIVAAYGPERDDLPAIEVMAQALEETPLTEAQLARLTGRLTARDER